MRNIVETVELKEFVKRVISDIKLVAEENKLNIEGPIEFEILVTEIIKTGGELKIYVLRGNSDLSRETIAKIRFKIDLSWSEEQIEKYLRDLPKENSNL